MCTVHKHLTIPHLYTEYSKICNAYITNDFFRIFQVGTAVANINKLHKKEMVSSFLYLSPFIDGGRNKGHSSLHLLFNFRIHAPLTKPRIMFILSSKSLKRSGAIVMGKDRNN